MYNKKHYEELKIKGICRYCYKEARIGKTDCAECSEKRIKKDKKKHKQRFDNGLCHYCGKEPFEYGYKSCNKCRLEHKMPNEKKRIYNNKRRNEFIKNGVCSSCGRKKLEHVQTCFDCWIITIASQNLRGVRGSSRIIKNKIIAQDFKCFYTGEQLVPGINASIDHLKPKKRFPELKNNPDNIVWCSQNINEQKRDTTKEEFITICHLIAKRFPI